MTKKNPLIFRARNGVAIEVPRRLLHEFKEIFLEECYTRELELKLPDQPAILDIGANAGFFSLFSASRFPGARIISFEPIPNNFKQLKRNKKLNENFQITCIQKAVYGYSGEISISFDPEDSFTTAASVFEKPDLRSKIIKVPCVTLQEIFNQYRFERCDLLKMDCEGAEYEILYNCPASYLRRISQIVLEVHGGAEPNQNIASLNDYLISKDFKTRHYSEHMLSAWHKGQC
ncbi:FkbM family methyltransferase [Thermodesulfobacteriota bacterium]